MWNGIVVYTVSDIIQWTTEQTLMIEFIHENNDMLLLYSVYLFNQL